MKTMQISQSRRIAIVVLFAVALVTLLIFFFRNDLARFFAPRDTHVAEEAAVARIIQTGDPKACDAITYQSADGTDYRIVCRNNIALAAAERTLDATQCRALDGVLARPISCERDILLKLLARANDPSVCATASTSDLRAECEGVYWYGKAMNGSDGTACASITSVEMRAECERSVIAQKIVTGARSTCAGLETTGYEADCIAYLAAKKDVTKRGGWCADIAHEIFRNACELLR